MQGSSKIKLSYFSRMCHENITSNEIDFILYIAKYQDDTGLIRGVYYRDICEALGISVQAFYDVMESLTAKGLIAWSKQSRYDRDIRLVGNDTSYEGAYSEGYIKANHAFLSSREFRAMKAGAKLLALECLRFSLINHASFRMGISKFVMKYGELLHVSRRTLRVYLNEIKQFFSVGVKDKILYVTPKVDARQLIFGESEKDRCYKQIIKAACHRERIEFDKLSRTDINSVCGLFNQYQSADQTEIIGSDGDRTCRRGLVDYILAAIRESVAKTNADIKKKKQWIRNLNPKFVHKILREKLIYAGLIVE